ncbi:MBL fold metallo-hydrolase [Methyloligella sp. 2.7D]|uniref:MBL fold metallo-hydrolase n=1 Tax=unclassified Methyloligella TaxID=2625955 RepID=UPI00157D5F9C|nr:MBL fold metallo-hydrolase [Methyloligella sp. GL2]QKP77166.1 MBL fold metallo-hydrolase [Methyloligella sp. GL2]
MRLTIVGCGDAFGAGGRLNTCFHVESGERRFLIDCGATSLVGLKALGIPTNEIDTIFVTHLHGDHFGGLPWIIIDAKHRSMRKEKLTIVGPEGIEERLRIAGEALYPHILSGELDFELCFEELEAETPHQSGDVLLTAFEVVHPSGAPPYAFRFLIEGKVLAFSGDTTWTDSLIGAAKGADLFICESYQYDTPNPVHLDFKTIDDNFERLGAKRILLTHMGEEMLARAGNVDPDRYGAAEDGMVIEL